MASCTCETAFAAASITSVLKTAGAACEKKMKDNQQQQYFMSTLSVNSLQHIWEATLIKAQGRVARLSQDHGFRSGLGNMTKQLRA